MKKLWLMALAAAGMLVAVDQADAFGRRSRDCNNGYVMDSCWGPGGDVYCGPGSLMPSGPMYETRTMTGYRPVTKTRTVKRTINEVQTKTVEEKFKYTVMERVVTPEKRKVTRYQPQMQEEKFTYSVSVPYTTQEKVKRVHYQREMKEVPYTVTVSVPYTTQEKRTITTFRCVPEEVVVPVTVCSMVASCYVDPCTGCLVRSCQPVYSTQNVTRTAYRSVPESREVMVNVTRFKTEQRQGTRTVCEVKPVVTEDTVNVTRCKIEQREGTRQVCRYQPVTEEVTVNVVSYRPVEREGTRQRVEYVTVPREVEVTECYTEYEQYTYTVNVPVGPYAGGYGGYGCGSYYAGYGDCCDDCGGGGRGRGGLFGRLFNRGGCN